MWQHESYWNISRFLYTLQTCKATFLNTNWNKPNVMLTHNDKKKSTSTIYVCIRGIVRVENRVLSFCILLLLSLILFSSKIQMMRCLLHLYVQQKMHKSVFSSFGLRSIFRMNLRWPRSRWKYMLHSLTNHYHYANVCDE